MPNKAFGGADERVRYALQVLDLEYEVDEDGSFTIEYSLGLGRTQLVFVVSETSRVGTLELRRVYSGSYRGNAELPPDVCAHLLALNNEVPFGSFATFTDEDETFLVFHCRIPADLDAQSLKEVLVTVALHADQIEEQLTGGDQL